MRRFDWQRLAESLGMLVFALVAWGVFALVAWGLFIGVLWVLAGGR